MAVEITITRVEPKPSIKDCLVLRSFSMTAPVPRKCSSAVLLDRIPARRMPKMMFSSIISSPPYDDAGR